MKNTVEQQGHIAVSRNTFKTLVWTRADPETIADFEVGAPK